MSTRPDARHFVSAIALIAGTTFASACGFEDPKGADAARGALNWIYPESLHVTSAVWRAQLDGVIERSPATKSLFAYQTVASRLNSFRDRMSEANEGTGFSVLLIGPMLWSQFRSDGARLNILPHAEGPGTGDVVVVTDEYVIAALVSRRLTSKDATELGLIRFYGPPADVNRLTHRLAQEFDRQPAISVVAPTKLYQRPFGLTRQGFPN